MIWTRQRGLILLVLGWAGLSGLQAQIQIGAIQGRVTDSAGNALPAAEVRLYDHFHQIHGETRSDGEGRFRIRNLPYGVYQIQAAVPGFRLYRGRVQIHSNLETAIDVQLRPDLPSTTLTVEADSELMQERSSSSAAKLNRETLEQLPQLHPGRALQGAVATTPGAFTENNGLIHIRGVDDGVLYVADGIPVAARIDAVSAVPFDLQSVESLQVIRGDIPAEFGGRTGAVVVVHRGLSPERSPSGQLRLGGSNFRGAETSGALGFSAGRRLGILLSAAGTRSDRYLDPVDPRNFHNQGGMAMAGSRFDLQISPADLLVGDLNSGGAVFDVPNDEEQQLAGQDQRQRLSSHSQSIKWQRLWSANTVTDFAFFRQTYGSILRGSPQDFPVNADQDRYHSRHGWIASWTHQRGGHTLKAGLEWTHLRAREWFRFAVTDEDEAEDRSVTEEAQKFTPDHPFVFQDRRTGNYLAFYLQDSFSPVDRLTLNLGLRWERFSLLTGSRHLSPRLGVSYALPRTGTVLRASFNRLYMPPQVENLLLADSEEARALSPFEDDDLSAPPASIQPERVHAYEAGFSQKVFGLFRLDGAYWSRNFRHFDDPNVFFNTTVVFPNSVASGFARGVDLRLEFPERNGWSGFLSYSNARVLQTGPIVGGLFLTDEAIEIGPGTRFIPDHDQRNAGSLGISYARPGVFWLFWGGRHESGVPLEVEEEQLEKLQAAPGAELVNFERERVTPWTVFDFSARLQLFRSDRLASLLEFELLNLGNRRFAYNFGNPFEGTHFGHPRLWKLGLRFKFD